MGPMTTAEHLDCALDEARQEIDALKERNSILEARLRDILADMQRMDAMIEEQMALIDEYIKGNK